MKKRFSKLHLHRETLRLLNPDPLRQVAGASDGMCMTPYPCNSGDPYQCMTEILGLCDPSIYGGNTACASRCVVCPE